MDALEIYVEDFGNTDECYNNSLTAFEVINIRVVAVNDRPSVTAPQNVLTYQGKKCDVNFHTYPNGELRCMYCVCLCIMCMCVCATY